MTDFKFKIGDRVTERPRNIINVASSKEAMKVYARNTKQRYGTVIDTKIKTNSRGARRKFIIVEWDGSGKSSEHSQMRGITNFTLVPKDFFLVSNKSSN